MHYTEVEVPWSAIVSQRSCTKQIVSHGRDFPVELSPCGFHYLETTLSLNSPVFLSEQRSLEDLFFRMESPDREVCESFKSLKSEVAFVGRVFIVYRPTGLNTDGTHRNPEILTRIKVLDFRASAKRGAEVDLEDLTTHEIMTVTYIPRRLFNYDVFVGVAHRQRLNWEGTLYQGQVTRKLSFMLIMKVRSPSENFSHSVTGIETPVKFRELFPDVTFTLNHTS